MFTIEVWQTTAKSVRTKVVSVCDELVRVKGKAYIFFVKKRGSFGRHIAQTSHSIGAMHEENNIFEAKWLFSARRQLELALLIGPSIPLHDTSHDALEHIQHGGQSNF